ncbi:MAG TPA: MraY family glycosyltransferase [Bacteroidales bacterium]|nr:MraY family glycosyltransferase [Bacteroidales bacterium]
MSIELTNSLIIILSFAVSLFLSFISISPIIALAKGKKLFDMPNKRGVHKFATPTLGGIAIFAGFMFSSLVFAGLIDTYQSLPIICAGCLIIFLVGLKDDVFVLSPAKKFWAQVIVAVLIVFLTDIRITNLHGMFGVREIPYVVSIFISIFIIIAITNAFNLIDGIDGLAASMGIISSTCFGIWFFLIENMEFAILCFAISGSLLGFIRNNVTKNLEKKLFMGDTGSLLIGFVLACIAIQFNESNLLIKGDFKIISAPAVSIGIMFMPLFDTLRVMIVRLTKRKSPFKPDRQHVHHLLLSLRYTHVQATALLSVAAIGFIIVSFLLKDIGTLWLLLILISLGILFYLVPFTFVIRKLRSNFNSKSNKKIKKPQPIN